MGLSRLSALSSAAVENTIASEDWTDQTEPPNPTSLAQSPFYTLFFLWCELLLTGSHHPLLVSTILFPSKFYFSIHINLYCSCRDNALTPVLSSFVQSATAHILEANILTNVHIASPRERHLTPLPLGENPQPPFSLTHLNSFPYG